MTASAEATGRGCLDSGEPGSDDSRVRLPLVEPLCAGMSSDSDSGCIVFGSTAWLGKATVTSDAVAGVAWVPKGDKTLETAPASRRSMAAVP